MLKTKVKAKYVKHTIKSDKVVDLIFVTDYEILPSVLETLSLLGMVFSMAVSVDGKMYKLGRIKLSSIKINDKGESKITYKTSTTLIDLNTLNVLSSIHEEESIFLFIKGGSSVE